MAKIIMTTSERELQITIAPQEERLPLESYVQIYPRVSTPDQMKNVSAEMQQDKRFALRCGWEDDKIILDTRDLGLSGQLRMEERLAFSGMISRIAEGKVKIVIAANVARLFRDRWGKEYARFMEICYTYGVKVIIPNKNRTGIEHIYDFSKSSDVELFRRKCEEAWAYIENQIGMMHALKDEVGYSGRWLGWRPPTGFIVDLRRKIGGEENLNYKKYIPYAPWAERVARLQARFREVGGNVRELYRELERTEFLFPPYHESVPTELKTKVAITPVYENPDASEDQLVIRGYKIASIYGLTSVLKNPANIGHFVYKGVIRYDNHPAIVDYMDFVYAFNRLSPTNLDGSPNVDYLERANRYSKRHSSEKPAFLREHIRPANDITYSYTTEEIETTKKGCVPYYSFYFRGSGPLTTVYKVSALDVDRIFLARFIERLQMPTAESEFSDFLGQEQTEQLTHKKRLAEIQVHIIATERLMEKLRRRLILLEDEEENTTDKEDDDLIKEVRKAYREHKLELKRLQDEYSKLESKGTQSEKRRTYKKLMYDAGEAWEEVVTPQDIIEFVDVFVDKVTIEWITPQFYVITIYWKDDEWEIDRTVCFKGGCPSPHWSEEEEDILRSHYHTSSDRELMQLLPLRSLNAIHVHAKRTLKMHLYKRHESDISANRRMFCLRDCELIDLYGFTEEELSWKAGGKQVTSWEIIHARNLAGSSGRSFPRNPPGSLQRQSVGPK